ncbi:MULTISPECIES: RluA family pseudouridine synthase [unclassified Corallococcus]|uniref:RluA family pseudouridine synthase n=1 Tax=unclassified Corallococcus TaxID=2685029 RepID=UPI001A8D8CBA|nr:MULTISPECIES: RluA family pseudouridine synthase [unclassified Corallococcus]MBN9685803.1 RluA family pseudouridine synthase [Corallococcus sp. NCSPR001]WAS82755.1 RluA family pseudouridine synthase [Corallococcus sp. NCRR]
MKTPTDEADLIQPLALVEGPLPTRLANPFHPAPPGPWGLRAAQALQQRLRREPASSEALWRPGGGKMFGVLVVVAPDGRVGYLSAFSGMLNGAWNVEGFVSPLFDPVARNAFWPAGEAELAKLEHQHAALCQEAEALRAQGRADSLRDVEARLADVEHVRAERSRALWRQVTQGYVIPNARGETQTLASLFAPKPPPGGAGDCAAPKLLAYAFRNGLTPLELAEFWWGAPPLDGRRESGAYYPACDNKCGTVLPYMLRGLVVELAPAAPAVPGPRVLHEDPWLLVIDKPEGLPTLPGRHAPTRDSVLVRLQPRFPDLVPASFLHELDPESSGLLVIARDAVTRASLQRQFSQREAEQRHVAWVDGLVEGDAGLIDLPLRPVAHATLEDCVDARHGKRTRSAWKVLRREAARTRVEFVPTTQVPHTLRIHAAHRLGLGLPITGDARLGREDVRLMLHADALAFVHPRTGERLVFASPAPF